MQDFDGSDLGSKSLEVGDASKDRHLLSSNLNKTSVTQHDDLESGGNLLNQSNNSSAMQDIESAELLGNVSKESSSVRSPSSRIQKATTTSNGPVHSARRRTMWGRTSVSIFLDLRYTFLLLGLLFLVMFLQLYLFQLYLVYSFFKRGFES